MDSPTSYFPSPANRKAARAAVMLRLGRPADDVIRPNHSPTEFVKIAQDWSGKLARFAADLRAVVDAARPNVSRRTLLEAELQLGWATGDGPADGGNPETKDWDYDAIRQFRRANASHGSAETGFPGGNEGGASIKSSTTSSFGAAPAYEDSDADSSADSNGDSLDSWTDVTHADAAACASLGPAAFTAADALDSGLVVVGEFSLPELRTRLIEEHQEDIVHDPTPRLDRLRHFLAEDAEHSTTLRPIHEVLRRRLLFIYGPLDPALAAEHDRLDALDLDPACPFGVGPYSTTTWDEYLSRIAREREIFFSARSASPPNSDRALRRHRSASAAWAGHRAAERELAALNHRLLRLGDHKTLLSQLAQWTQRGSVRLAGYECYAAARCYSGLAAVTGRDMLYLDGICETPEEKSRVAAAIGKLQARCFAAVVARPLPRELVVDVEVEPDFDFTLGPLVAVPWPLGVDPARNFAHELALHRAVAARRAQQAGRNGGGSPLAAASWSSSSPPAEYGVEPLFWNGRIPEPRDNKVVTAWHRSAVPASGPAPERASAAKSRIPGSWPFRMG